MAGTSPALTPASEVAGLVRTEQRAKGPVWIAEYRGVDGKEVRKTIGMAWVRDSGKRTAR